MMKDNLGIDHNFPMLPPIVMPLLMTRLILTKLEPGECDGAQNGLGSALGNSYQYTLSVIEEN